MARKPRKVASYEPRNLFNSVYELISKQAAVTPRFIDGFARIFLADMSHRRPHKLDPEFTAIFNKDTKNLKFDQLNEHLKMFDVLEADTGKRLSRGIKVQSHILSSTDLVDVMLGAIKPQGQINIDTGKPRPRPAQAVKSRDINGNNAIRLDVEIAATPRIRVGELLKRLSDPTIGENERKSIVYLVDSTVDEELYVEYVESQAGRLYVSGGGLQTVPKDIRRLALGGWEIDLSNCHPRIMTYLSKAGGYNPKAVQNYIENTKEVRLRLADQLQVSPEVAKRVIIATLYGGRVGFSLDQLLVRAESDPALLRNSQLLNDLNNDVRRIQKAIIQNAREHRGFYINALGKGIKIDQKKSKIVAHIVQGVEQMLMRTAFEGVPGILSWEHDGVTIDHEVDLEKLQIKILDTHQILMPIEIKSNLGFG
mgnify:FL=1